MRLYVDEDFLNLKQLKNPQKFAVDVDDETIDEFYRDIKDFVDGDFGENYIYETDRLAIDNNNNLTCSIKFEDDKNWYSIVKYKDEIRLY